jgi:hypothetical protein
MSTYYNAGSNSTGQGGSIHLAGGSGITNGNIIIDRRNNNSICELVFTGTGTATTPTVSLSAGTFTGTNSAIKFILPTNVGSVGQVLKTDGAYPVAQMSWQNVSIGAISLNELSNVQITNPVIAGQVLYFDGTYWINKQAIDPVQYITVTAGIYNGTSADPSVNSQGTTFITTLPNSNLPAVGFLGNGIYNGMIKRLVAADLHDSGSFITNYSLDVFTNTKLFNANNSLANYLNFIANGNSVSLIWNQQNSSWYMDGGAGVRVS